MKVILFGATGMVGQGVLRKCRLDTKIHQVITIVRSSPGTPDRKLRDCVSLNLSHLTGF